MIFRRLTLTLFTSLFRLLKRRVATWLVLRIGASCLTLGILAEDRIARIQYENRNPVEISDQATPLKAGPWGILESIPIHLEPPEEYLPVRSLEETGRTWKFIGFSTEMLVSFFGQIDLTAQQKTELLSSSAWGRTTSATIVTPSTELIFSLSPSARKSIYTALLPNLASGVRSHTATFRVDRFEEQFANSGVSKEVIQWVKDLSFRHGELLVFCDAPWVLQKLPNFDEKARFLKATFGKPTLLLRLHVMPDSNINSLMNYWSRGPLDKDNKPMLESLSRIPGGARISLVHLLPPMPAQSLYTFPFPSTNAADRLKDCHWTALNFFKDPPDLRLTDHELIQKTLAEDYYPVFSDPRYGDLVQFVRPNGDIIHTAVYIADDVLYTKNSPDAVEPFMLMTRADVMDLFTSFIPEDESLHTVILRNKYY